MRRPPTWEELKEHLPKTCCGWVGFVLCSILLIGVFCCCCCLHLCLKCCGCAKKRPMYDPENFMNDEEFENMMRTPQAADVENQRQNT